MHFILSIYQSRWWSWYASRCGGFGDKFCVGRPEFGGFFSHTLVDPCISARALTIFLKIAFFWGPSTHSPAMADNKDGSTIPKEPTPGASTSNGPSVAPEPPKRAPKPPNPVFKMMGELTIPSTGVKQDQTHWSCGMLRKALDLTTVYRTPKFLRQTPLSKLDDLLDYRWNLERRHLLRSRTNKENTEEMV